MCTTDTIKPTADHQPRPLANSPAESKPGQLHGEGDEIPLALRIAHVARDASLQGMLGGVEYAARVTRERAGGAFDPAIAMMLADQASDVLRPRVSDSPGVSFR